MKCKTSLCVALFALPLVRFSTEAQQLDSSRLGILTREVGSEVRVSTPSAVRIRGRLLEVTSETVLIDQAAGPLTLSFSSRDTLWVRERLGATGAMVGAAVGLATAGAILLLLRSTCGPGGDDPCTGFAHATLVLGARGAVVGAGVGFVVGELKKDWVRKNP
jgi:hypothetical protein